MDEFARNAAERRTTEIEQMIAKENDEGKRANLVALNSINNSLIANTELSHTLCDRMEHQEVAFTAHVQKGDRLFYFGKGVWFVLSAVLVVAQALIAWGLVRFNDRLDTLHDVDVAVALDISAMKGEIQTMKGSKGDTGDTGAPGKAGKTGETGETGPAGKTGPGFWGPKK